MRILANENVPGDVVLALREQGHDVAWIRTDAPGSRDPVVLALAESEDRTLLTFDKDFGALAFERGMPASAGIVLFRLRLPSPEHAVRIALSALASCDDWRGHFSVVEEGRIRMTPMPPGRR